jgi:hypothetical protein
MTLATELVEGVAVGQDDRKIANLFEAARATSLGGLREWVVGVRNAQGAIYRCGVLIGYDAMVYFTSEMEGLGYVDELAQQAANDVRFDAIFRLSRTEMCGP